MQKTALSFVALQALFCPLTAQSTVLGLGADVPLVVGHDASSCVVTSCAPAGFPATTIPFAGGTAYDSTDRGLWISNGLMIAKVDARDGCSYICPPAPMPGTGVANAVSGLAYNELTNTLFVTDLASVIRWYTVSGGCSLALAGQCSLTPPGPGFFLTGIATDDRAGIMFYCWASATSVGGRVLVAQQGGPCSPFCGFPINECDTAPLGPLQGLAYEACANTVWATDGGDTVGGIWDAPTCQFFEVQCCSQTVDRLVGLCVMPATEVSDGTPCAAGSCPTCTPEHVLGSDPYPGNTAFSLDLIDAPANTNAWLVLNVGPCAGPGLGSPPFCAPILVPFVPPWSVNGPYGTGGTTGCTGSTTFPLPIPNWSVLCGVTLSSQWVGVCFTGGFGTYVSNCLSWTISGT